MAMDLEATMDETDVIVIDMGSGVTKIGFCGEDAPRACVDTVVGQVEIIAGGGLGQSSGSAAGQVEKTKKTLLGLEAYQYNSAAVASESQGGEAASVSGSPVLTYPVKRGMIDHGSEAGGSAVESLLQHAFTKVLGVEPEDFPVLLLDSPTETKAAREWMGELLFEKFKVKSLAMFNTAVMSLFSTGKTRGLVLESGDGVTHAVPVFEGYAIPHAMFKLDCGGSDITEELYARCVDARIVPEFEPAQQVLVMRKMKEKLCEVVIDYDKACSSKDPSDQEHRSFELPDGSIVQIPHDIRYAAGEVLFSSDEEQSVQHICASALNTLDPEFRAECMHNIVLTGGTSMLPGVPGRISSEVQKLVGSKVELVLDSQRKNAAWIGGSMFASFSTFPYYEITKADYEEQGKIDLKSLIARKTY